MASNVSTNFQTSASDAGEPADGACRLADWGVILATGPDSASFLHGQLTQDMLHLGESQARLAGYCSAKGRLLATFTAWRSAPEQIALACSADLLTATLKRLSMFVLRAKCRLTAGDGQLALYGLVGPTAEHWLAQTSAAALPAAPWSVLALGPAGGPQAIRLPSGTPEPRWLLVQPHELPAPPLPALTRAHWDWLEVRSGVVRVVAATAEQFVPQMVNLELTGGVNFQKGCYPGQEVVARSQYRGTLKRRTFLMTADGPLAPGQEVHHSSDPGQPAGLVALAAPVMPDPPGGHLALVECKSALVGAPGEFTVGTVRLKPAELPYPLSLEPA
ncbi:MAG: folate-binding protein [Betaproteobacteria bacterium]